MATPKKPPVNINLKASIRYREFKIFFGSLCRFCSARFIKFSDVNAAIRLPRREDFALSKLKKNQKIAAVARPKKVCAERIPIAVVFALSGSIGMLEKFTAVSYTHLTLPTNREV